MFCLRAGTVGKTITISRRNQGTIFNLSLWNFDNTILIRLSICFELRITVVNVICNCVCHRTIKVPAADHSKHRRIANYREQLSVLWQFGCLSLSIHEIKKKKRTIVQNVHQRPYVYFKWTQKSSFCSHTKDRKSDVSTIQFIVFFILYFYILVTEHSRFLIHTQLFTSYWIHLIPLHYFIHARTRPLYSLTWQHIALFFNYNKGQCNFFYTG